MSRRPLSACRVFGVLLALAAAVPAYAQTGLVAAYSFDEGGGTSVSDASGNGHDGIISGAAWTSGKFGGALAFDGASNWVTVPDGAGLELTAGMTLEAWINATAPTSWRCVIMKERSGGLSYALYGGDGSGHAAAYIRRTSDVDATSGAVLPSNVWTHVAATYDGAALKTYVNGTQVASRAITGNIVTSAQALRIGGNSAWGEYFSGLIDEVRIYNRALTVAEIQADINTPVGSGVPPTTFSISGTVAPVAAGVGATVTLSGPVNASQSATGTGQFTFDNLPNGAYSITASKPGFSIVPTATSVPVSGADVTGVDFTATALPSTTVSITQPASGATVAGTVTVSATASSDLGIAGVQFQIDGANRGSEDTIAPYALDWDTTSTSDGSHTLRAIARDGGGNLTTSTSVVVTVRNSTAPTGLVAAYGFDESAGTAAGDASGNGNTGVISGATWTAGKFGGALAFDGTNDWVTVESTTALAFTNAMTLEAWINTSSPSGWRAVLLKERSGGLSYALYGGDGSGHAAAYVRRSSDMDATSGTVLPVNTWVHLATTYDGAAIRLYVNGVQAASTSLTGDIVTSTQPLRIGGDSIWGEYFTGTIDEIRLYNRALSAADIQADMIRPVVSGGTGADTTPPLVSLSAPASGATVSGTVTVSATATDNVGMAGVQFQVDGVNLGREVTSAPYSVSWDTKGSTNGSHTLRVVARDVSGNSATSASRTVVVNNTADPAVVGHWDAPFETGMVAVNTVLMHTGKVLMFAGSFAVSYPEKVWDPVTGALTEVPNPYYNLFCAGQAQLPDGRILVAGGHDTSSLGAANANIFDPVTQRWSALPNMAYRRWYPTVTALSDGRMLITSGGQSCLSCLADIPEIFDPATNTFTKLTSARLGIWYYPFMFVLPDGRVLSAGSNEQAYETRTLNMTAGTWSMIDPVVRDGHSAVMYRPGKILKTGTAADSGTAGNAQPTAYVIDMNQPSPAWRQVAPMHFPRAFQNSTILPDGNVLITGGGTALDGYNLANSVKTAELWSPQTETFQTLSDAALGRLYHSTALLLPDGRVLIAGSGDDGPAVNQTKAEIYSPPYLFKGARPSITGAPDLIQYNKSFVVQTPDAASVRTVALMRPGSVTHAFDEDQRYVELTFTPSAGGLTITAPANANLAPAGYYMLFLVNNDGVPSVASWVHFPAPSADSEPPTAPTNLMGQGGIGTVALNWTGSTDNSQVALYNVHRASTPGFVPSAANRVGQTAGTSFNSTGIAAGTYYYVVTAQDIAGNISAPSNELAVVVNADVTAPLISITSPANQSTVSGSISLTASASDNVGVVGIQFRIDGVSFGPEQLNAPYTVSWNTAAVANGGHTVAAIARDASGNISEATSQITVANTTQTPSGLVAAYGFGEGGGTTTSDASGFGNVGTIQNATWTATGHTGSALSFDGATAWVTVPNAAMLSLTAGMTIEAWVQPTSGSGWRSVIMKESANGLSYALYSSNNASRPGGWVHNGSDLFVLGNAAITLNSWTHVAVTYDGSALRFYTNGVLVGTTTGVPPITAGTGPLRIGGNSVWGEYYRGLIDDVRVYNRALSAAEIQRDMNAGIQ